MSRTLLHMHLQRLEAVGLVTGQLELSEDGKAMKYFEVAAFEIAITPASIRTSVSSLADALTKGDGPT